MADTGLRLMTSADRRDGSAGWYEQARRTRRRLRGWLRRMDLAVDRRRLSRAGFIDALKKLGIGPGATVCVHSSMDAIARRVPRMSPLTLVNLLKELLGPQGTLLVPTFPFAGELEYHYVQRQRVFDVGHTPSRVGLLTEVFRRTQGVVRSWHPTHPIAAWGRGSQELLGEHHLGTAFGQNSPLFKMRGCGGLVVGIGVVPKLCFSVFHVAEELHPVSHAMHYGTESFEMKIVDAGTEHPYRLVPLRPDRVRRYDRGERILTREGILRFYTVSGLRFSVTDVRRFLDRARELIDAGRFYGC